MHVQDADVEEKIKIFVSIFLNIIRCFNKI